MMRFMHSHGGRVSCLPAPRGIAILLAAFAGGCSAEISRFDFPGFSLTDDKKKETQTASLQSTDTRRGPSYLGNEGRSPNTYDNGGYTAPRTLRESTVATANLPEPPPSQPSYGNDSSRTLQPTYARPAPRPGESVEVQQGDTLYGLSRRHGVSVAELMEVNGLSTPSLRPGQRLYLPEGYGARPAPPRTTAAIPVPPPAASAPASPAISPADQAKYAGSYAVKSGDSLYAISRSYGVPLAELQRVNGITDVRSVKIGTVLKVPDGYGAQPAATHVAVVPPAAQSIEEPTVINRREQVAAREPDVSTSAISPPSRSAAGKLRWPVQGKVLTGFGQRNDGTHNDGINLSVPQGTPVHAAEAGTVAYAGNELKGYGNLILVRHDNGWVTAYAHNEDLLVKRGDKVQRGQVIAKAGRTGSVDQPQLHFELRQGSKPVDPLPFLERI